MKLQQIYDNMKTFLLFMVIMFACNQVYPQNNNGEFQKSNYDVFREMCYSGLDIVDDYMTEYGKEKVVIVSIKGTDEVRKFISGIVKQKAGSYRFLFADKPDSNYFRLEIENTELILRYPGIISKNIFSDDFLNRYFKSSFNIKFFNDKGELLKEKNFSKEYTDKINMIYLETAERSDYTFTKGTVPEKSFLSKIIVPAAIVAVSALTIILFFAIRSK